MDLVALSKMSLRNPQQKDKLIQITNDKESF